MRYHDPAKEETEEQVQLHSDCVCPVRSITFTPPYGLEEFNMGQYDKVAHAASENHH